MTSDYDRDFITMIHNKLGNCIEGLHKTNIDGFGFGNERKEPARNHCPTIYARNLFNTYTYLLL